MYKKAIIYEKIYGNKNYEYEANIICDLIRKNLGDMKDDRNFTILEAGCGTCSHLKYFVRSFDYVCGFDLYKEIIEFAEEKFQPRDNKKLFQADMSSINVDSVLAEYGRNSAPFDAVISLFGCISYLLGRQKLEDTFKNFFGLVRSGGVVIVESFLTPDDFVPYTSHLHTYDGEDMKIARISKTNFKFPHPETPDEQDQIELNFNFMVTTPLESSPVEHFVDVHHMQLYSSDFIQKCCENIGFVQFQIVEREPFRKLYVMRKP